MEPVIRCAEEEDWDSILYTYETARQFMRDHGNPTQWGTVNPTPECLQKHMAQRQLYVVADENEIYGAFALLQEPEPTYRVIREGKWLNDEPYITLHRVASNGKMHGIMNLILQYAFQQGENVRIDTHRNNTVMQRILEKNGFVKCGIIFLENGDERLAYQKKATVSVAK